MTDICRATKRSANHVLVRLLFFVVVGFSIFNFVSAAEAATLSVSPATGNFSTQNTITVSLEVNTNQAINGVEGVLEFPTSKLELLRFSKSRSIMSMWVQEPSFSNGGQTGVFQFSAIKLNPGFVGSRGNVVDVVFREKDAEIGRAHV